MPVNRLEPKTNAVVLRIKGHTFPVLLVILNNGRAFLVSEERPHCILWKGNVTPSLFEDLNETMVERIPLPGYIRDFLKNNQAA